METKTLIIIGAVLLALAGILGIQEWFKSKPAENLNNKFLFEKITPDSVDSIVISQGKNSITLVKNGANWQVDKYQADALKINSLFTELKKIKITGPISRNKDNHSQFEIDDQNGIKVVFKKGELQIADYTIGKSASDYQSGYIRQANQDLVYMSSANLRPLLGLSADEWRDKTIAGINDLDKGKAKKIEFNYSGGKFSFDNQENNSWAANMNGKSVEVKDSTINDFFSALNPLTADNFIEDAAKIKEFDASKTKKEISAFDAQNNLLLKLSILEKDNEVWIKNSQKQDLFQTSKTKLSNIILNQSSIFAK